MPSLRQKVTTYFRQLSFIADQRDGTSSRHNRHAAAAADDDDNFITKYLQGRVERTFSAAPEIFNGQEPGDLPQIAIGTYLTGSHTITAACTGPDEGLTGIKRSKLHLSASYADIDFIDTAEEGQESGSCSSGGDLRKSNANVRNHNSISHTAANIGVTLSTPVDSSGCSTTAANAAATTTVSTSDQNANKISVKVTSGGGGGGGLNVRRNSKPSLTSALKTTTTSCSGSNTKEATAPSGKATTIVVSMVSTSTGVASSQKENAAAAANTASASIDGVNNQKTKTNPLNAKTERNNKAITTAKDATTSESIANAHDGNGVGGGEPEAIAGVRNWRMETDFAFGISVSLYENNMLTKEPMGSPIADCYGMVARGDAAMLALADGVNWGDGARLAARSAVHGCLDYLDRAIFGLAQESVATTTTTTEVFVSLLRSLWEGHGCILEVGGALSTLTIAVVLPVANSSGRYVVCACNVGDSLGYVYSKKHGVFEFTQASHDITSMRDMRDALGALGPADGNKPELSNLTLSLTEIERGDIVFLTSDGISDNFDPVVGKFAEAWTPDVKLMSSSGHHGGGALAPKRQNKSASAIYTRLNSHHHQHLKTTTTHPSSAPPSRPPRSKKLNSPPESSPGAAMTGTTAPSRPKYMRSHTTIEPRRQSGGGGAAGVGGHATAALYHSGAAAHSPRIQIPKSISGLPMVTGPQRHALTLHRLEDLLSYGINGTFSPCASARRLCHLLIDFVRMITSARRKTLEQRELFYKFAMGADGVRREVEYNRMQHRAARKRVVDSSAFAALPGKLDHATVVAYIAGGATTAASSQQTQCSNANRDNANDDGRDCSGPIVDGAGDGSGSGGGGGGGGGGVHFAKLTPLKSHEFYETNF